MSLASQVSLSLTRVGTEFKTVYGRIGNLSALGTTSKADLVSALNEVRSGAALASYPVGAIFMSASSANPSASFGGTWAQWGVGRVPVSVDVGQSEFNTVEETGGEKTHTLTISEMPAHSHTHQPHSHGDTFATVSNGSHKHVLDYNALKTPNTGTSFAAVATGGSSTSSGPVETDGIHTHSISGGVSSATSTETVTGYDQAHNNLQPYITCYMWKRTA